MARPRKPTGILDITGAFKNHPNRRRPREPQPRGDVGKPPDRLNEAQRARWAELVDLCAPGVLTEQDRPAVELFCRLWQDSIDGRLKGSELAQFRMLMCRLGLTPSDRSNVKVPHADHPAKTKASKYLSA